jgi:hypothetical protein
MEQEQALQNIEQQSGLDLLSTASSPEHEARFADDIKKLELKKRRIIRLNNSLLSDEVIDKSARRSLNIDGKIDDYMGRTKLVYKAYYYRSYYRSYYWSCFRRLGLSLISFNDRNIIRIKPP